MYEIHSDAIQYTGTQPCFDQSIIPTSIIVILLKDTPLSYFSTLYFRYIAPKTTEPRTRLSKSDVL